MPLSVPTFKPAKPPISVLDAWLARCMRRTTPPTTNELRHWQLTRINELLVHAQKHSTFYAQHLKDAPRHISSHHDMEEVPLLSSHQLRTAPEKFLCVSQDEIARVITVQSSGTTGSPKRLFYTTEDLQATIEFFAQGIRNMAGKQDTICILMPATRPDGVASLLLNALGKAGIRAFAHGILTNAKDTIAHILTENATCIIGSPAHLNILAVEWKKQHLPITQIRSVLLCWDSIPEAVVQNVSHNLGCHVFRHWGMIETGLGGAVECTENSGLHIREADLFIEIIDPVSGKLLPDGEYGEIVVTTLLRSGMPLIRYRTGDLSRIIPQPCICNSPLRRLDARIHRMHTEIVLHNGLLSLAELNEIIYAIPEVADFSVSITPPCTQNSPAHRVLTLRICAENDETILKIQHAITALPVIQNALAENALTITTLRSSAHRPATEGLGKRQIFLENV